MMALTPSKQWIHLLRSDRWVPTSSMLGNDAFNFGIQTLIHQGWPYLPQRAVTYGELRLGDTSRASVYM